MLLSAARLLCPTKMKISVKWHLASDLWSSQLLGSIELFLLARWFPFPVPLAQEGTYTKRVFGSLKEPSWKLKREGSKWGGLNVDQRPVSPAQDHTWENPLAPVIQDWPSSPPNGPV
jgi:hypothetical protein